MEKAHEVYWSEAAAEDLKAIIEYIRADNPSAAKESLGKIQSKTAALRSFPQRGRIVPELKAHGILQYRELVISPWRVIYHTQRPGFTSCRSSIPDETSRTSCLNDW